MNKIDKELFNKWNETKGSSLSEEEIEESYSKVLGKIVEFGTPSVRRGNRHAVAACLALAFAACIAFVSILSVGIYKHNHNPEAEQAVAIAEPVEWIECSTQHGEIKDIVLSDSSHVTLNSGSLLVYPSEFRDKSRSIYLNGEAVFDVTHDDAKPFVVGTSNFSVMVHGTKFDVCSYSNDDVVSATLCNGSVSIKSKNDGKWYYLVPDQRFSFARSSGKTNVSDVDASEAISWIGNGICFNSTSFRDIMHALERRYGVQIFLSTSRYNSNKITAKFIHGESLNDLMKAICKLVPGMKYRRNSNGDIYVY